MSTFRSIIKQCYAALPFKQPAYKVLRRLGPPPERIYRHLHFKGTIEVDVSPTEHFRMQHHGYMIENELFWKGLAGWEKVSMELWTRLSKRCNVILDIGANTGMYALVAIDNITWPPKRCSALSTSGHFNFLVCQPTEARAIGL